MGFELCSGFQNTHLHAKDDPFKPVNIDVLFMYKTCELWVHDMFCTQFDANLSYIPRVIIKINELKSLVKHVSCYCRTRLICKVCNLKQRWNSDKC